MLRRRRQQFRELAKTGWGGAKGQQSFSSGKQSGRLGRLWPMIRRLGLRRQNPASMQRQCYVQAQGKLAQRVWRQQWQQGLSRGREVARASSNPLVAKKGGSRKAAAAAAAETKKPHSYKPGTAAVRDFGRCSGRLSCSSASCPCSALLWSAAVLLWVLLAQVAPLHDRRYLLRVAGSARSGSAQLKAGRGTCKGPLFACDCLWRPGTQAPASVEGGPARCWFADA